MFKKKLLGYAEIFGAAFAVTALVNVENLFNAHGLNALKAAAVAALVAAAKAGYDALVIAVLGPR